MSENVREVTADRVSVGAQETFTDTRGAPPMSDTIWVVKAERVLAKAREFFGCPTLESLPLMGYNQLGEGSRDSHWETRIMNDE